jgi:hypothetical protein
MTTRISWIIVLIVLLMLLGCFDEDKDTTPEPTKVKQPTPNYQPFDPYPTPEWRITPDTN